MGYFYEDKAIATLCRVRNVYMYIILREIEIEIEIEIERERYMCVADTCSHKICLQAYRMGLTTENHVWMFPAWYRPDWYKSDYKLPNETVLCTKDEVCFSVFSLIPMVLCFV